MDFGDLLIREDTLKAIVEVFLFSLKLLASAEFYMGPARGVVARIGLRPIMTPELRHILVEFSLVIYETLRIFIAYLVEQVETTHLFVQDHVCRIRHHIVRLMYNDLGRGLRQSAVSS